MIVTTPPIAGTSPADSVRRLTGPGIDATLTATPGPGGHLGLILRNADGTTAATVTVDVTGAGTWGALAATIEPSAGTAVVQRVNRLLLGYGADPSPSILTDWRLRQSGLPALVAHLPGSGSRVPLPASVSTDGPGLPWRIEALLRVTTMAPTLPAGPAVAGQYPAPGVTPTVTPVTPTVTPVAPVPVAPVRVTTGQPLPAGHPGIFTEGQSGRVPMHLDDLNSRKLASAYQGHVEGDRTAVILRGPAGTGKTQALFAFAADRGLPVAKFEVQALRDVADWLGKMDLRDSPSGGTVSTFIPSAFFTAIDADGPYAGHARVVILDEITRAETAGSLNVLLSLFDGTGTLYVPDAGKTLRLDPAVFFGMTANIGTDYTATVELDRAFTDRTTTWVRLDYADPETEARILTEQARVTIEQARQLVTVATQVRTVADRGEIRGSVSTRQLIAAAQHVRRGILTPAESCIAAFTDGYSSDGDSDSERAKVMTAVMSVLGGQS